MNGLQGYGLVLSGGGAKGAYQVGAWKALREKGLDNKITAVSAASVGLFNAALFCENKYEEAVKLWKGIEPIMFLEPELSNLGEFEVLNKENPMEDVIKKYIEIKKPEMMKSAVRNRYGAFSRDGIKKLIRENVNLDAISNGDKKLYTIVSKCGDDVFEPRYELLNKKSASDIEAYMMAASAIPFVYDAVMLEDGNYYVDGGMVDNVPIKPLYDAGYRNIIVIGLKPDYGIDYSKYEGCEFTIIMPPNSIGGFVDGTLDFQGEHARFRMELGYLNTLRILNAYESGRVNEAGYLQWLVEMDALDREAANRGVRQQKVIDETNEHMDKIKGIYAKYM